MIRETLGPTLRAMRERAGLTQREAASRVGVAQTAISKHECGTILPPLDTLEAWAKVCGCAVRLDFAPLDGSPPVDPWTAEAREAADILEAATPEDRALLLTVLRRMAR